MEYNKIKGWHATPQPGENNENVTVLHQGFGRVRQLFKLNKGGRRVVINK